MYTVLLVDDEKNVTDSLKEAIPWINLGVENVIACNESQQALNRIRQGGIDLIISDIQMPKLSGLELLRAAREFFPDIHCILLTAYDEFDYALQALRLGVDNYLMKPLHAQELVETIETALDNIYARRKNQSQLFKENLLRRWISGNISHEELSEKSIYADINIYHAEYCIIGLKPHSGISVNAFLRKSCQLLSCLWDCCSVSDNNGRIFIITGGRKITLSQIQDIFTQTLEEFGLSDDMDIAVGQIVRNAGNVVTSCQSAGILLDSASGNPGGSLLVFSDTERYTIKNLPAIDPGALSPIVGCALEYILEHYAEGITLKEFSILHKTNAAYMGYLFKNETGVFFNDYLAGYRLEKAKELLCTTNVRVNTIAEKVGYPNPSYFIATFRRKTNLSPQKYREIYGENHG